MRLVWIAFVAGNLCGLVRAADTSSNILDWLSISISELSENYWREANYSRVEWAVSIVSDKVVAVPAARRSPTNSSPPFPIKRGLVEQRGNQHVAKVSDGWLIGWDAGEWGGSIWWYSSDGATQYQISSDQIIGFYRSGTDFLAPAGLAHMSINEGKLLRLSRINGRWVQRIVVDLKAAPMTACLDKAGVLIVATMGRLVKISKEGELAEILTKTPWDLLYPNSMVITVAGDIFIGMRNGVVKVPKVQPESRLLWLVQNKSFLEPKHRK